MTVGFRRPDWIPRVSKGSRILVAGATGGLGRPLVAMLLEGSDCIIGAHGNTHQFESDDKRVIPIQRRFDSGEDCRRAVDEFVDRAGGIDGLVVLSGAILSPSHWKEMTDEEWRREIDLNLNIPAFLAGSAMEHMKGRETGGRIILTGTESALHGGSPTSLPYAVAKRGTECLVQGLAREGAPSGVLVNGLRLGFIASGFHQRWHGRTERQMAERADLVPLKRGGDPDEAAALMIYLLSDWAAFITGQMLALTGGDWL